VGYMILKKIIFSVFVVSFLTGCLQNTAFLGPALTVASSGNIYHAGLSYGSSHAIKKMTGKTPTENFKSFIDDKGKDTAIKEKKNDNKFFVISKNKIEKQSYILNLVNQ
tara:strand:+ start:306 stop:632 length:327 start_codon:yes stop_codon:yes gene_type:complete